MTQLEGRLVLVTGAAGGIGTAVVTAATDAGARVLACDIDSTLLPPARSRLEPGEAAGVVTDLADLVAIDRLARAAADLGGCDVLVNNAAEVLLLPTDAATVDEFQRVIDVNVRAAWYLAVAVADQLGRHGRGSIVNVGSTHPRTTKRSSFPYNVSKGALAALTAALTVDLGARGVRVNTVSPGIVATAPTMRWLDEQPDPDAATTRLGADHPLGRCPTPPEVAAAVVFLASDAAAGISGAELVVDAGRQVLRH